MIFNKGDGFRLPRFGFELIRWTVMLGSFVLLIWGGNLVGCFAVGSAIRFSRVAEMSGIVQRAAGLCAVKAADSLPSLLILAFFCGILMYLAVDTFKRELPPVIRMVNVFNHEDYWLDHRRL